MSMSTMVMAFRPPDEKWKAMRAVWDACKAAGLPPPDEVERFFNWQEPSDHGVVVDQRDIEARGAVRPWRNDCREGFEVDLRKLPPDVTVLRFWNGW